MLTSRTDQEQKPSLRRPIGMAIQSNPEVFEQVRRRLRHSAVVNRQQMGRGLTSLASIISTAPFFGFLGTCLGIYSSFRGANGEKSSILGAIFGYLADGIIPTALGLLVAIPALWCHRYLANRISAFETEMEQQAADLLFLLQSNRMQTSSKR